MANIARWHLAQTGILIMLWQSLIVSQTFAKDSESQNSISPSTPAILNIEITGLDRTDSEVVHRELKLENDELNALTLQSSIQSLKNLRIFSEVEPEINQNEAKEPVLKLNLQEKWTTIPIMKYSSGGGTQYFVVGAYDINSFGKFLELGAQYENWNGEHAGVVWFRNPRFFNQRLNFSADVWSVNRPRFLYDENAQEVGSYVLNRKKINVGLDKEFRHWLKLGIGVELDSDQLIEATFTDPTIAQQTNIQSTDTQNTYLSRFLISVGKLNYDNYLVHGKVSELTLEKTITGKYSDFSFSRLTWDTKSFWRLPLNTNIGARILVGITDTSALQHTFLIGGIENIRGFYDGQFKGRAFSFLYIQ